MVITRITNDIMRENSSLVNMSRIRALITTLAAAAASPCRKRRLISCSTDWAIAQAPPAIAKISVPHRITGLRPMLSDIGP
ncbi:hypothetical protein D3C80_1879650 [compost metagenome]